MMYDYGFRLLLWTLLPFSLGGIYTLVLGLLAPCNIIFLSFMCEFSEIS